MGWLEATADGSGRHRVARLRRRLAAALLLGFLVAGSAVAETNPNKTTIAGSDYDSLGAGHPLRIAAYMLHPVGVILDRLILRPAAWLGRHEPIKTLVGNTD